MVKCTSRDEDVIAANRAFEEMRIYAADCLKDRNPEEIAKYVKANTAVPRSMASSGASALSGHGRRRAAGRLC